MLPFSDLINVIMIPHGGKVSGYHDVIISHVAIDNGKAMVKGEET